LINVDVGLNVKSVPAEKGTACGQSHWGNPCKWPAENWYAPGEFRSVACQCEDHAKMACRRVALAFVEKMLELHGNVHFEKTQVVR